MNYETVSTQVFIFIFNSVTSMRTNDLIRCLFNSMGSYTEATSSVSSVAVVYVRLNKATLNKSLTCQCCNYY